MSDAGMYQWLTAQGDEKMVLVDLASQNHDLALDTSLAAWSMLRAQARAFYLAADEIKQSLKRSDPQGDWRLWHDKQYWSN